MPEAAAKRAPSPDEFLPPYGAQRPTTVDEVMQVVEDEKIRPCYFINAKLEGHKINQRAQEIMDFVPSPTGTSILRLILHMTEEYLPTKTPGRNPRLDFVMQQVLLSFKAKEGRHPLPVVRIIAEKKTGFGIGYYDARVYAEHLFSPKQEYLGTLCYIDLIPLTKSAYLDYVRRDKLVSPLPEELLQGRFSAPLKALYKVAAPLFSHLLRFFEPGTVGERLQHQFEARPMKPAIEMSDEELKALFGLERMEQAMRALPHDPDAKRHGEVEYLYRVRELVKRMLDTEMKRRLWGNADLDGEVSFHFTQEKGGKYYYYKAAIPGDTAPIRDPLPEEVEAQYGKGAADAYRQRLGQKQGTFTEAVLQERSQPSQHFTKK